MASDRPEAQPLYAIFINSLRLVAADYEEQVQVLPTFIAVPDEVADTFSSAVLLLDQIESAGFITAAQTEEARD